MRTAVKTAALMSLGIPLASMPAITQDDEGELAPIVITGSKIPTVELESPFPVVTIDHEEIDRSGAETVGELLKRLPQNNSGSFDEKIPKLIRSRNIWCFSPRSWYGIYSYISGWSTDCRRINGSKHHNSIRQLKWHPNGRH